MRKYCKAYPLQALRQFPAWKELRAELTPALSDESIVYLWDDWTVVENPVLEQGSLFDQVTPEWQAFCQQELHFTIPEDIRYADY